MYSYKSEANIITETHIKSLSHSYISTCTIVSNSVDGVLEICMTSLFT